MRTKLLRPVVVVPVVVVVAAGVVWLGFRSGSTSKAAAATTQQLFSVSATTLRQTVSASGTIAPADTEDLSFAVAGTVATVNVKAGQTVKQGQALATVGSAALLSAVAQAKATLDSAQATLAGDESADASSAQIANDNAEFATAYESYVSATGDLSNATLTSPIAGTVATMNLTVGEVLGSSGGTGTDLSGTGTGSGRNAAASSSSSTAGAATAAASSSSTEIEVISTAYVVNLSVDTTTVGNLKIGQSATVTPTSSSSSSSSSGAGGRGGGFPGGFGAAGGGGTQTATNGTGSSARTLRSRQPATGTITSLGTIASASSGVATFPVVISVSGTPTGFHAGASASAVITYKSYPNVLAVPTNAITCTNGQSTVLVSANGSTARRTVTTGITSSGEVQIISGLRAGEQIVVTVPSFRRTSGTGTTGNENSGGAGGAGGAGQFPGGGAFTGGPPGGATP